MYPRQYLELFRDAIEPQLVFVGMSFKKSEQWRWDAILAPASERAHLRPYRVDSEVAGGSTMDDIVNGIARSGLLLST